MYTYKTNGTCSNEIKIKVNNKNIIEKVEFVGGCEGNLKGITNLVEGEKLEKIKDELSGIKCRNGTSCPDQLSIALENINSIRETKIS